MSAAVRLSAGDVVDARFRVRGLLGEGGVGQVYEADDLRLQRRVAIKLARRGVHADKLVAEGIALASIRDPSVVEVHAIGDHDAWAYLVMERLYGVTLDTHLARSQDGGARLAKDEILDRLSAITHGLRALHRGGLFHGDLKPANIMLAPGERTVLLDVVAQQSDGSPVPRTPHYLAPELLSAAAPVGSPAADLYALGVIAFELCAGRVPFDGSHIAAILYQHLTDVPPRVTSLREDLPPGLADVVASLLAKRPEDRIDTAETVHWLLEDLRRRGAGSGGTDVRLLVVDDDPEVVPLVTALVRARWPGVEIQAACDGADALRQIRAEEPDVILLDLVMPEMSGIELCTHLRGAGLARRSQIISIGARTATEDVSLLNLLGITQFVPKGAGFAERLSGVLGGLPLGDQDRA